LVGVVAGRPVPGALVYRHLAVARGGQGLVLLALGGPLAQADERLSERRDRAEGRAADPAVREYGDRVLRVVALAPVPARAVLEFHARVVHVHADAADAPVRDEAD